MMHHSLAGGCRHPRRKEGVEAPGSGAGATRTGCPYVVIPSLYGNNQYSLSPGLDALPEEKEVYKNQQELQESLMLKGETKAAGLAAAEAVTVKRGSSEEAARADVEGAAMQDVMLQPLESVLKETSSVLKETSSGTKLCMLAPSIAGVKLCLLIFVAFICFAEVRILGCNVRVAMTPLCITGIFSSLVCQRRLRDIIKLHHISQLPLVLWQQRVLCHHCNQRWHDQCGPRLSDRRVLRQADSGLN